jgi:enoyl-CoA hydratase/carnithine racemase
MNEQPLTNQETNPENILENILLETRDGVAWLTLNRPEKLNALIGNVREEILAALAQIAADPAIRVLVITGAGKGFCAGGDVDYMAQLRAQQNTPRFAAMIAAAGQVVTNIRQLPQPVIAMVNGVAAGAGLNLALACDLRIVADTARFSQAFAKIGLHPDWGGTFFLPRLIGTAKACELIFTGDLIDAATALQIGLVNQVVAADQLLAVTTALAQKLAARPRQALALAKQAIYQSLTSDLATMLAYETSAQLQCFQSEDCAEGLAAFQQRRTPNFT